ncbi:hypothetical protein LR48_Vigan05g074200 [Vigna angularis]|uniref:Ubiquitin-like protease family profile domain-containing protein n=1 Tax=Phaseolus angularis TaxID=3914 RepID=A0A0L9UK52_PHAAN|nr:hypothetical protein LR48_Vigan05g074200 [Vigna angularis]
MSTLVPGCRRSVTRLPEVTSQRVNGQRRHVDIDPMSGVPSGPSVDRFRSYMGVLGKTHVSILLNSWEYVPEVDKNLLRQDIQDELVEQKTQGKFVGQGRDDILTTAIGKPKHAGRFIRPHKQSMHQPVIDEDDDLAEAEDDSLAKLMTKLPRYVDIVIVDQGRSSMYGPQTIQPSGNTIESKQKYLETWMTESNRDIHFVPYIDGSHWQLMLIIPKQCKIVWFCSLHRKMKNDLRNMLQGVMGKNRGQLVFVLYPKVCKKQLDSWECGYYVMSWIKTIIRAVIIDDWNEDAIKKIRQEWTTYLLQRWT